ncbi:unnamed protein product (macronuclear) [Paramecium tetraurelia]|uniref:Protein-tyrosine-phosphatase n=1 Tax=Paramecium tetraurelia TaxID=5888 RepID=A0BCE2_PARTE|nr:uncharacterized protein GSPATT00004303001 [Paramecium tetraurelia]CAK56209.1 unnamed protein product [Paramecium tetraurelia]|eukprot:XP_001423607.1 hypothetical protein (macronuclear) [Paramecium tetraurelia strain d4-2]
MSLFSNTNMSHVFTYNSNKLFIGNIRSPTINMRAVLSVIETPISSNTNHFHKQIPATDEVEFKLNRYFDEGADFIHNHLKYGNVLVHCYAGISRSASLVVAYLIKYHNYTTLTAVRFLQKSRPIIEPNDGFIAQLKEYENRGKTVRSYLTKESKQEKQDEIKPFHRPVKSFLSSRMKTLF